MGIINNYIKYLYYLLIIIIVVLVNILLFKVFKITDNVSGMNTNITKITDNINKDKEKAEYLKSTAKSWKFFISIYAILVVISETFKYRKRYKSFTRSFSHSLARHSRQLRNFR